MKDTELELDGSATAIEKLQPKWKNEPTYADLNADLVTASAYHNAYKEALLKWEEDRNGGKAITAKPGKSTVRPKLIRKQNEWKYPALEEPFLSTKDMFKVSPRTEEDAEGALQNEQILNYQWSTQVNKTKIVNSIVRNITDEGSVIVKTMWKAEEGIKTVEKEQDVYASPEESYAIMQQKVQSGEMSPETMQAMMETGQPVKTGTEKVYVDEVTLVKNCPDYEVCNPAMVIIDPTCEGIIENAGFVIHEYYTNISELMKDEYSKEVTEEIVEELVAGKIIKHKKKTVTESGFYKNLGAIEIDMNETNVDIYAPIGNSIFKYKDKARKKIKAKEYWGYWDINGDGNLVSIVATWVGKVMIRLEENPFPHKRIPFSIATYMPVKREVHGQPDAELLVENQESVGKMTRAAHDITATHAVGQTFVDEQFFPSPAQKNNYEKGNTVYFRHGLDPKQAIHKQSVPDVPASVFNMIQMQNADAESLTGTKAFSGGIGSQAFGSVAQGIRSAMDSTAKREMSILRRLSELFKDMARLTVSNNQAFLSEEETIRVTNSFVKIRRDDIQGEFDFELEVSTPEKDNETAEKLTMLMQTNAASMDQELVKLHYIKIAKLWKMPDLAEAVEQWKPKQDPRQDELMNLQLENARLENISLKKKIEEMDSRISERVSRSLENDVDMRNKNAQAILREAQAAKLESERDKIDQDFVDNFTGASRQRQLEDEQLKEQAKMSQMEHKRLTEMDKLALNKMEPNADARTSTPLSPEVYEEPQLKNKIDGDIK